MTNKSFVENIKKLKYNKMIFSIDKYFNKIR